MCRNEHLTGATKMELFMLFQHPTSQKNILRHKEKQERTTHGRKSWKLYMQAHNVVGLKKHFNVHDYPRSISTPCVINTQ